MGLAPQRRRSGQERGGIVVPVLTREPSRMQRGPCRSIPLQCTARLGGMRSPMVSLGRQLAGRSPPQWPAVLLPFVCACYWPGPGPQQIRPWPAASCKGAVGPPGGWRIVAMNGQRDFVWRVPHQLRLPRPQARRPTTLLRKPSFTDSTMTVPSPLGSNDCRPAMPRCM